ncbi:unnamed protein product [Candida parapsilosis]
MKFIYNVSLTATLLSLIPIASSATVAAAAPANASPPQGSFKIDFNVRRGSSKENLSPLMIKNHDLSSVPMKMAHSTWS